MGSAIDIQETAHRWDLDEAQTVYCQSIPAIKSATCGILTHRETYQLIFTHSLHFTFPFPDVLHYTPLKFFNVTTLFSINKTKKQLQRAYSAIYTLASL